LQYESEQVHPRENPSLPQPGQDRSLVDVHDDFRRILRTDGPLDGDEDRLDHLREQFRSIEREAARAGTLYEELIHLKTGGVEHDVIPVDCIPVKLPPGKRKFFERS
jgi:hypothetical protein